ncbi:hypothetical protein PIB30_102021, partial [Stylosanthes scabra]|nr:hypothetical protein [Stylosanthes scabra]
MATSNHRLFVQLFLLTILIVVCLNNTSTFAHNNHPLLISPTPTKNPTNNNNETVIYPNINILVIVVANDLSPDGPTTLHFKSQDFPRQKEDFDLVPGSPVTFYSNFD